MLGIYIYLFNMYFNIRNIVFYSYTLKELFHKRKNYHGKDKVFGNGGLLLVLGSQTSYLYLSDHNSSSLSHLEQTEVI